MQDAILVTKNAVSNISPPLSTSYGFSMGGFGALAFAGALKVDQVLALSPQASVFRPDLPLSPAWKRDVSGLSEVHPITSRNLDGIRVTVAYDPFDGDDVAHIDAIRSISPISSMRLPFSGHNTPRYLINAGMLSSFVKDFCLGTNGNLSLNSKLMSSRWNNISYLYQLWLKCPKHHAIKNRAFAQLGTSIMASMEAGHFVYPRIANAWAEHKVYALIAENELTEAIVLSEKFYDFSEQTEISSCIYADALMKIGEHNKALSILQKSFDNNPKHIRTSIMLSLALLKLNKISESENFMRYAIENNYNDSIGWRSAQVRYWRMALAEIHSAPIDNSIKLAAIECGLKSRPNDKILMAFGKALRMR